MLNPIEKKTIFIMVDFIIRNERIDKIETNSISTNFDFYTWI